MLRYTHHFHSYPEFLKYITKKYAFLNHHFFLFLINLFLIVCFYIMISALSTLFFYQFGFDKLVVTLTVICICFFVFRKNDLRFMYGINTILMPVLIIFVMCLTLSSVSLSSPQYSSSHQLFNAIVYGILYFSYNSLLMIPILFHVKIKDKKSIFRLSFLFSFMILILTLLIDVVLLHHFTFVEHTDLPIFVISDLRGTIFSFFYFFIILSAIITTLFSSGFSFMQNIKSNKRIVLPVFLGVSILFNFISFSNLIDIFYPIFGVLGLLQIGLIFIS